MTKASDSMRKRANKFLAKHDDMPPIDDLVEFICAEIGRTASPLLADASATILYFENDAERDDFVQMVQSVHPNFRTKKL
jgi:hypothetical protein